VYDEARPWKGCESVLHRPEVDKVCIQKWEGGDIDWKVVSGVLVSRNSKFQIILTHSRPERINSLLRNMVNERHSS